MQAAQPLHTSMECMPCLLRQAVEALELARPCARENGALVREIMQWLASTDWSASPPRLSQRVHRLIRERTGCPDPYLGLKAELNRAALDMLPEMERAVPPGMDVREAAVRMAAGGNMLDAGAKNGLTLGETLKAPSQFFTQALDGDWRRIFAEATEARRILYVADNAGEIVFDRCLLAQLPAGRVTVAVRGGPVINDATLEDARLAGLFDLASVIANGSDAPGTILDECSQEFRQFFDRSDLIIAKGQGNYETLGAVERPVTFIFQVKCRVIAARVGAAVGTMIVRTNRG